MSRTTVITLMVAALFCVGGQQALTEEKRVLEEKAPTKKVIAEKKKAPLSSQKAAKVRSPGELVALLENASVAELQKLSFIELNVLKNAVFASRGYVFADDRPWLNLFFCGSEYFNKHKFVFQRLVQFGAGEISQFSGDAVDGFLQQEEAMRFKQSDQGAAFRITKWDLRPYKFPACKDSGPIDEHQKKAIANLHVAVLKKVEALGSPDAIDKVLAADVSNRKSYYWSVILGKELREEVLNVYEVSLRRDLHGYHRLLSLAKHAEDFDSMELLGLYAGDLIFLKNIIEAQQGKPFTGVLGWEISQLIGITEQKQDYDPARLSPALQERLRLFDEIVGRIMRSDLNDIPVSLRSQPIEFSNPYDFEGC